MICVVIVDSQEEYRKHLCDYLSGQKDMEVTGSGADGYEAIKLVDIHKPDIVLMDMNLPQGECVKTAALIKYRSPKTSVIINGDDEERQHFSFFSNGVSGYISKNANDELFCHAIRAVYYGGSFISPEIIIRFRTIASGLAEDTRKSAGFRPVHDDFAAELPRTISSSEIQIMSFVGQGYTNKEIAEKLCLTEGTVRNYVSSVLQKTGFRDRTQVAIYAVKAGI